jgi:uncharacterized protein (DUF362 family)
MAGQGIDAREAGSMSVLQDVLVDEVETLLARWRVEFAGRPDAEAEHLWLLALEREQIVAVAYREESVAGRVDALDLSPRLKSTIRQALVWIWKDEELHAEYLRGILLQRGGLVASAVVYGRQVQGALSGWVTATEHHRDPHEAPLRTGAAGALVAIAATTGRIPPAMRRELRFQTFRRYCKLNVVLEMTAELAYRRLVELSTTEAEREVFTRIHDDERRHTEAFRVLVDALTDDGRLAPDRDEDDVIHALQAISVWFLPASLRPPDARDAHDARGRSFGTAATVVVRSGEQDRDKVAVLEACLDRAGLAALARESRTAAIRVSFMLGYDRRDRSNVNDPELVAGLAAYLRRHGVSDVAVIEAPTVYGTLYAGRSVAEVARYFGFDSPDYRVVDIGDDLRPMRFERGLVQQAMSATWADADLRIVMPKLRTDPTEFAHLCLSSLEGSTGPIDDTFYVSRRIDFRSATMMLLDVAPPDFAIVDAWAPVADGPFGVMGCRTPASVRHVYAGRDALAVDEVVLADLGVDDPCRAPIVRRTHHWFGLPVVAAPVDGVRPALGRVLRGAHASASLRALGVVSYPVYMYLSNRGELFVPEMDVQAFPPTVTAGRATRAVRWASQRAFGLRAPAR